MLCGKWAVCNQAVCSNRRNAARLSRNTQKKLQTYATLHLGSRCIPLTAVQFQNLGGFLSADRRKIPGDFILALGDNAAHSYDSRDYGFVAVDSIYGKLVWK